MDPVQFRIIWDVLFEAIAALIVLSFLVERALALVVEHRFFVAKFNKKGIKEVLALIVSYLVVRGIEFDVFAIVFKQDEISRWGIFMTSAVVAGGSKASVKLFHDLLGVKSQAQKAADEVKQ
ncbi:MAG: hypothetical protein HYX45_06570 [Burkholderiales bacterium]|nr:hypothetical protein [Burkholderiales bacterium]